MEKIEIEITEEHEGSRIDKALIGRSTRNGHVRKFNMAERWLCSCRRHASETEL